MARDAKISLQPDQILAEVNEVEISDSNARCAPNRVASWLMQFAAIPIRGTVCRFGVASLFLMMPPCLNFAQRSAFPCCTEPVYGNDAWTGCSVLGANVRIRRRQSLLTVRINPKSNIEGSMEFGGQQGKPFPVSRLPQAGVKRDKLLISCLSLAPMQSCG
jgi:hypothetical protein